MTAANPLVSVVVPVFDGAAFLGEALASVAAQTYAPVETIVVDDGSRDASAEIAARAPRVRLLRQANAGVAAARNRGVREASGEVLAFLDQDDRFTPDKLARQLAALLADPGLGFCLAHQRLFLDGVTSPPSWVRPQWLAAPIAGILPGTLVVRRSAFDRIGPFLESEPVSSDSDWFMRARDLGVRSRLLDDVLLERRIHAANQSANVRAAHLQLLRSVRRSLGRRLDGAAPRGAA
jgi:glycosyltransferase involved in cell wall biosynthesis